MRSLHIFDPTLSTSHAAAVLVLDHIRMNTVRKLRAIVGGVFAITWHAVRLYRAADWLYRRGHPTSADAVAAVNRVLTGVDIEPGASIGPGLVIMHGHGIVINKMVCVGRDCQLFHQVTLGVNNRSAAGSPVLGDRVTVFAGAKILGRVSVGDDAVIGANAVVLADVPPRAVAVGVPARVVGHE